MVCRSIRELVIYAQKYGGNANTNGLPTNLHASAKKDVAPNDWRRCSAPETAPVHPLPVAFYVGPLTAGIAVCLFGADPEDVERAVVVLNVRVTEPQVVVASPRREVSP